MYCIRPIKTEAPDETSTDEIDHAMTEPQTSAPGAVSQVESERYENEDGVKQEPPESLDEGCEASSSDGNRKKTKCTGSIAVKEEADDDCGDHVHGDTHFLTSDHGQDSSHRPGISKNASSDLAPKLDDTENKLIHSGATNVHYLNGELIFECNLCKKMFTRNIYYWKHMRYHTRKVKQRESNFDCNVCNKSFRRSAELIAHEQTHAGDCPFACKYCKKPFSSSEDLEKHERIHTDGRPFECPVCMRTFKQRAHLQMHERSHAGEDSFECSFCKKTFSTSRDLQKHERIHTGGRPFECKICQKTFKHQAYLRMHERIHADKAPFACKICKETFTQAENLELHERTHTDDRSLKCKYCETSFCLSEELRKHEDSHACIKDDVPSTSSAAT